MGVGGRGKEIVEIYTDVIFGIKAYIATKDDEFLQSGSLLQDTEGYIVLLLLAYKNESDLGISSEKDDDFFEIFDDWGNSLKGGITAADLV